MPSHPYQRAYALCLCQTSPTITKNHPSSLQSSTEAHPAPFPRQATRYRSTAAAAPSQKKRLVNLVACDWAIAESRPCILHLQSGKVPFGAWPHPAGDWLGGCSLRKAHRLAKLTGLWALNSLHSQRAREPTSVAGFSHQHCDASESATAS